MAVQSLLTEPLCIHSVTCRDPRTEAERLLRLVGLPSDFGCRYPHQLSGGQARRRGGASPQSRPDGDEPAAGLDVPVQGEALNLLARLQEELGIAILIITQNLNVVRHVADRTATMYLGRVVETGSNARHF